MHCVTARRGGYNRCQARDSVFHDVVASQFPAEEEGG